MTYASLASIASIEFSVHSITTKSDVWTDSEHFDYSQYGRNRKLIHIITSGKRQYRYNDETFELVAGQLLFIPDHTKYQTWNLSPCSGIGVCFCFDCKTAIEPGIFCDWYDDRGEYIKLFERLDECHVKNTASLLHKRTLLLRILDKMTQESSTAVRLSELLAPALQYIREHYRENLPVSTYASICSLSESYFRRIFVSHIGMTPIEYRNSLRFEEVFRLRNNGLSMSEIAECCGFCDTAYMYKLFRKQTGQSMKHYVNPEIV